MVLRTRLALVNTGAREHRSQPWTGDEFQEGANRYSGFEPLLGSSRSLPDAQHFALRAQHSASLLVGDDLVLDLVVDGLWNDVLVDQLVLALVRASFDDSFGACIADAV